MREYGCVCDHLASLFCLWRQAAPDLLREHMFLWNHFKVSRFSWSTLDRTLYKLRCSCITMIFRCVCVCVRTVASDNACMDIYDSRFLAARLLSSTYWWCSCAKGLAFIHLFNGLSCRRSQPPNPLLVFVPLGCDLHPLAVFFQVRRYNHIHVHLARKSGPNKQSLHPHLQSAWVICL